MEHEIVTGTMKSLTVPKILPLEYPTRVHARQARSLALSHVASPPLASQYGVNLKYQRHTANNLNHYTSRSVPGYVEVVGTANSQATVTVNGTPTHRRGDYFRQPRRPLTTGFPLPQQQNLPPRKHAKGLRLRSRRPLLPKSAGI